MNKFRKTNKKNLKIMFKTNIIKTKKKTKLVTKITHIKKLLSIKKIIKKMKMNNK